MRTTFAIPCLISFAAIYSPALAANLPPNANYPANPNVVQTYDPIGVTGDATIPITNPPAPAIGVFFPDPDFPKTTLIRITDPTTSTGGSCRTSSAADKSNWNADDTLFWIMCTNGASESPIYIPFSWNPQTLNFQQLPPLPFGGEPDFSYTNPNVIYGIDNINRTKLLRFTFNPPNATGVRDGSGTTTTLMALPTQTPGWSSFSTGATEATVSGNERVALAFNGTQDTFNDVMVYDTQSGHYTILETSPIPKVDGVAAQPPNGKLVGFEMHRARIDRSGRWITIEPGNNGIPAGGSFGNMDQPIWDVQTGTLNVWTGADTYGHHVVGYGTIINVPQVGWLRAIQDINNAAVTTLFQPAINYSFCDGHESWNNVQYNLSVPYVSEGTRTDWNGTSFSGGRPFGPFDQEIFAVRTDGEQYQQWRFCHHRSVVISPTSSPQYNFWDYPRGGVSQDGKFYMFTSNWNRTLGADPADNNWVRQDVFVAVLSTGPAYMAPPAPSAPSLSPRAYPNPWRSDRGYPAQITFDQLTGNTTIKIFTLSGHFVKGLPLASSSTTWDLTNESGNEVASGIYLYLATNNLGQKVTGKLAVIR